jgi:hypothetical protein
VIITKLDVPGGAHWWKSSDGDRVADFCDLRWRFDKKGRLKRLIRYAPNGEGNLRPAEVVYGPHYKEKSYV